MLGCRPFITRRINGRIYGLNLKGNGQLRLSMRKMASDLKSKGKNPGYTQDLGKGYLFFVVVVVVLTKMLCFSML